MLAPCKLLIEEFHADPDAASPYDPREPRTIGKGRDDEATRVYFTTVGLFLGQCASRRQHQIPRAT